MSGFANGASYNTLTAQLGSQFRTPTFHNQIGTFHTPYYEQWSLGLQQAMGTKHYVRIDLRGQPRSPHSDLQ